MNQMRGEKGTRARKVIKVCMAYYKHKARLQLYGGHLLVIIIIHNVLFILHT